MNSSEGMDMMISELQPTDFSAVVELCASAGAAIPWAGSVDDLQRLLRSNPCLSLVARCEGRLTGVILTGRSPSGEYVQRVMVTADSPPGLNHDLVARAMAKMNSRGLHMCRIHLDGDDTARTKFWDAVVWSHQREAPADGEPSSRAA